MQNPSGDCVAVALAPLATMVSEPEKIGYKARPAVSRGIMVAVSGALKYVVKGLSAGKKVSMARETVEGGRPVMGSGRERERRVLRSPAALGAGVAVEQRYSVRETKRVLRRVKCILMACCWLERGEGLLES
jgi:hypothetical protein